MQICLAHNEQISKLEASVITSPRSVGLLRAANAELQGTMPLCLWADALIGSACSSP